MPSKKSKQNKSAVLATSDEILDALPQDIQAAFKDIGKPVTREILLSMAMYRGPYMPAAMAAEYERYFPGWGTRMLELAEKESSHRQQLELRRLERTENRMDSGQKSTFAVAGLCIFAAMAVLTAAPPSWHSSMAALGLVVVGIGGPTVARIIATRFNWPGKTSGDLKT